MFLTNHFIGRLQYETDEVVCINIHVSPNILGSGLNCSSKPTPVISQMLVNKKTKKFEFNPFTFYFSYGKILDGISYLDEIQEIVNQYFDLRKRLQLE